MKEPKRCSICGEPYPADQLTEFDGKFLCSSCFGTETTVCSCCDRRIWEVDNSGSDSMSLCESCYDNHYTTCSRCDRIIRSEDAYYENDEDDTPYCRDCYNSYCSTKSIRDYYFKPAPIFYGENERYFGMELEVDGAGEEDDSAERVMNIGNREKCHIYCKHDGSLDDGFEIVSHPMTLDYHKNVMPWESVLRKVRSLGYTSHQAETCGLL